MHSDIILRGVCVPPKNWHGSCQLPLFITFSNQHHFYFSAQKIGCKSTTNRWASPQRWPCRGCAVHVGGAGSMRSWCPGMSERACRLPPQQQVQWHAVLTMLADPTLHAVPTCGRGWLHEQLMSREEWAWVPVWSRPKQQQIQWHAVPTCGRGWLHEQLMSREEWAWVPVWSRPKQQQIQWHAVPTMHAVPTCGRGWLHEQLMSWEEWAGVSVWPRPQQQQVQTGRAPEAGRQLI
jgi:hypothetical protein